MSSDISPLDPLSGVVHADNQHRDSYAYDVMQPVRPYVDEWLLDFINNHSFSKKDFFETRDGGFRLTLKLCPVFAETIPLWREKVELMIKCVKEMLVPKA